MWILGGPSSLGMLWGLFDFAGDVAKACSDIASDVGGIAGRFRFWGGDVAGDVLRSLDNLN